jgi:ubiquinone/menaquinone biosynthesis C-methylase UbiE
MARRRADFRRRFSHGDRGPRNPLGRGGSANGCAEQAINGERRMVRDDFVKAIITAGEGRSHWLHRESYVPTAMKTFSAYVEDWQNLSVLDVGCGQGHDVAAFSVFGIDAEGIEINPRYLKEGRKVFPGIKLKHGNAEKLPYPDDRFSLVYCRNLVFCTDPRRSLPELVRVVRRGGVGHVSLDVKIVQLSDDSLLHSASMEEMLALLPACEILQNDYCERVDDEPTPHRHQYHDVYFRKRA